MMLFCRPQFGSLMRPARLVYDEAVDTRMAEVVADGTRPISRRANFTRDHLTENGLTAEDLGLAVSNLDDDNELVRATIALQMKVFPDRREEWDGMYGRDTFRAYERHLEGENKAKLGALREKIEKERERRYAAEGAMVEHLVKTDDALIQETGLTDQIIKDAQNDCKKGGDIEALVQKNNFMRVLNFAAKATDCPRELILATVWAETYGTFMPRTYGPVDELGMGQFLRKYWGEYTRNPKFIEAMGKVTSQNPAEIGRARSIVADLVAVGIKLKEAERLPGIALTYGMDVRTLTDDDLIKVRFHYYAPGYSGAKWLGRGSAEFQARAEACYDRVLGNLKSRFVDKVRTAREKLNP